MTGKELEIRRIQDVKFCLNNRKFIHQFCVRSLDSDADGIIGMDFLSEGNASVNLENLELRLSKNTSFKQRSQSQRARRARGQANRVVLTVFATRIANQKREQLTLEPRNQRRMQTPKRWAITDTMCAGPAQLPMENVSNARGHIRTFTRQPRRGVNTAVVEASSRNMQRASTHQTSIGANGTENRQVLQHPEGRKTKREIRIFL